MLTHRQFEKIVNLVHDIEINSYQLAIEQCEGYSYSGIEVAQKDLDKAKSNFIQYLEMLKWNTE